MNTNMRRTVLRALVFDTLSVSDSEALIHLAYVQHLWESKLVVILEGLTRGRIALCSEMQLARKSLQMHFDVHVCLLEKSLLCSFDSKNFCKFCTIFGPQNGGWKMDPKMAPEFGPQNGVQKWHPKVAPKRVPYVLTWKRSTRNKILSPPFGCHFETPFWGSNSGTIFGSIFQPPFWGPKMVQNLQKFLLSKLHNKLFSSKQTCTSKCICSDFLASCISEHNVILPLVKPSKITTSFDSHKCCT